MEKVKYSTNMNKYKINFSKDFFIKQLIHLIIGSVLYVGLFLILYFYAFQSVGLIRICDCFFTSGFALSGIAGLIVIGHSGIFDVVSFGFANMFSYLGPTKEKKYSDVYTYKQIKETRRNANRFIFIPYLLIGIISLVVSIIIFFCI